jgi:hypothetical protein
LRLTRVTSAETEQLEILHTDNIRRTENTLLLVLSPRKLSLVLEFVILEVLGLPIRITQRQFFF